MLLPILGLLTLIFAVGFQLVLSPLLANLGIIKRQVESVNNARCRKIDALQACEHTWLHEPSGLLYAACSDPVKRSYWTPANNKREVKERPRNDYLAIYDTNAGTTRKVSLVDFALAGNDGKAEINVHGFDIHVGEQSADGAPRLDIFMINHRPPLGEGGMELDANKVGANSTIEHFTSNLGAGEAQYVKTYFDEEIITTPNSVVATSSNSFLFTNDHGIDKASPLRLLNPFVPLSNIGYCNARRGCKEAYSPLTFANGITRGTAQDQYWVASSADGLFKSFELQADGSLVLGDSVKVGMSVDNLSTDSKGSIWAAGLTKALQSKWRVEKKFEDDGSVAPALTMVVHDAARNKLFLSGLSTPFILSCDIYE
ncbi:PROTEIN POML-2 [Ceraceosorus bombacis]|uniref:PROTEIN POML-2 n=1 Tax=Ceraceosorus bombacis TaxID=401625 RepID=A0A0P1BGA9_9BASI|nr:PROTEIN POML-2 [Ceraceosorus bombacis]